LPSSIYPLFLDLAISSVKSVTLSTGGTGYSSTPTITFTGGAGAGASASATILNGVVTSVIMTSQGHGYTSAPTVTFVGGNPTVAATGTSSVGTGTISSSTDILSTPLAITTDFIKPGGGGILRLSFAFTFAVSPATVSIFNNTLLKGNLNADNSTNLITDGYYRFDIDVESGDSINLQASQVINPVRFVRVHLAQIGA